MQELKLSDLPSVKFWLKKAAHSPRTVKTYLYYFKAFIQHVNLSPEETVQEWQRVKYDYAEREKFLDRHSDLVEKFYCQLEGHTPKAKVTHLAAILSFFRHNKIPLEVDIQEKVYIVNHNRAIQKEEIKRILDHATLRDRCFFLMMLESGLRPQTLVSLRYRNLKTDFEAGKVPMMISLDSDMLKDFVSARFTFIGEDGFKVLKEYLATRTLKDDDVIFAAVHTKQQKEEFLSPSLFSTQFGVIIKKLGISEKKQGRFRRELNLYTLRKYFRNNVKTSDPAYREFWMGHSLGVDAHYFESWKDDPNIVEKHREEYARAYSTLRVFGPDQTQQYVMEQLREKDQTIKSLQDRISQTESKLANIEKLLKNLQKEAS